MGYGVMEECCVPRMLQCSVDGEKRERERESKRKQSKCVELHNIHSSLLEQGCPETLHS